MHLVGRGVVTGECKRRDRGLVVTRAALGSQRLSAFLDRNEVVRLAPTSYTHDHAALRELGPLVALNAALEVDLTGQVSAERGGGGRSARSGGRTTSSAARSHPTDAR